MSSEYKIYPAIGIARVGDSTDEFYLAPAQLGQMPIKCGADGIPAVDKDGNYKTITSFKDSSQAVKRQAAQFKVYYTNSDGKEVPLVVKDEKNNIPGTIVSGPTGSGELIDIVWTVHLANKKASWYEFHETAGEHGYDKDHKLRNADITNEKDRRRLIIDPGPQTIWGKSGKAEFAKGKNPLYAQTFPPDDIKPFAINTLGEIFTNSENTLTVLGGHGCSGSTKTSFPKPSITAYANNDGWFDDTSDGPVTAKLAYYNEEAEQVRYIEVYHSSWVVVGYPRFAPEIPDLITMNDVVFDLSIKNFAYKPQLYGTQDDFKGETPQDFSLSSWQTAQKWYNPDYYPKFYEEIWPILSRPSYLMYVTSYLGASNQPHNTGVGGNFEPTHLNTPPKQPYDPCHPENDPGYPYRQKIFLSLRMPGEENIYKRYGFTPDDFLYDKPLMPLLFGDNGLSNTAPNKFLRLTDTQLFILRQWRDGKFINEKQEDIYHKPTDTELTAEQISHNTLDMGLGGAFCPGAEVAWIIRNPAIYSEAYRINVNPDYIPSMQTNNVGTTPGLNIYEAPPLSIDNKIDDGLEPGDITKYSAMPWQSDFNECNHQALDVTYQDWVSFTPNTEYEKKHQQTNPTLWWPSHRPLEVFVKQTGHQANWTRGIPFNAEGDLKMVTAWKWLGFVKKFLKSDGSFDGYFEVERNTTELGDYETHEIPVPKSKKKK